MSEGAWEPIDDHIAWAWVKAQAKREWGGVTPLGEDPKALYRLWLRRVMGFVRALAARSSADNALLTSAVNGWTPDANTQSPAEYAATAARIEAAVRRAIPRGTG